MAKSDFLSQNEPAFSGQQKTFKTTIGSYAALLGVTPAQVITQAADSDYYEYVLACRDVSQNEAQQWSAWKALMRKRRQIAALRRTRHPAGFSRPRWNWPFRPLFAQPLPSAASFPLPP